MAGRQPPKDHSIKFWWWSEFRILNMNFLKYVIAGELLVERPFNRYQAIPQAIIRQMNWRYRFHNQILYPEMDYLNLP